MPQQHIVFWLSAFSLVSLGGAAAGLLLTSQTSGATESVVMAVTAGTFLYVGATEVRGCVL